MALLAIALVSGIVSGSFGDRHEIGESSDSDDNPLKTAEFIPPFLDIPAGYLASVTETKLDEIVGPLTNNQGRCGMPAGFFRTQDRNSDGAMTPAELQSDIRKPDIFYSDRMRLVLGGKRVDLIYPGKNHSDDATVLYFPEERVVFATEFISDVALPATGSPLSFPSACGPFDGSPLSEWIRSYRTVELLDFDIFAGGHGALAKKADVTANREFFEELVALVSTGMAQGKTLPELQQSIQLEKYKDWAGYAARRAPTIESAYNNLKLYR